MQELQATEIESLYEALEEKLAPRTCRHIHSVFSACLGTAVRTRRLLRSPMIELAKLPSTGDEEEEDGAILDAEQLQELVVGFKTSPLFAIVATAARTGARRGEILALRVRDLDPVAKTLRIERAVEETKAHGLRIKGTKKESTSAPSRSMTISWLCSCGK